METKIDAIQKAMEKQDKRWEELKQFQTYAWQVLDKHSDILAELHSHEIWDTWNKSKDWWMT